MSNIMKQSDKELVIMPYEETRSYRFSIGKTGPMKEYGLAIARAEDASDDPSFYGGCIPVEDVDELIKFMCKLRGYEEPTRKLPEPTVQAIF